LCARKKSKTYWCGFDFKQKKADLIKFQKKSENPDIWENPDKAQKLMKRIASLREEVDTWQQLDDRVSDALELAQLEDDSLFPELEQEVESLEKDIEHRELDAMLSGKYDRGDAFLAIHAGAGGVDAQDWTEMLERMYLRWAETEGFKTEILDMSEGEEAGIKSITIAINGLFAFGYLRAEKGVHRLVRLSPFDAAHRRHTSFALVEILPQVDEDSDIKINSEDLRIDVFRSSGAGGQNVQKNATAIRITHLPTEIVVSCQNERSQVQNRENAMRVLKSRLLALKEKEQEEQLAELRGEYTKAEWGSQIRSYVLHPYQMVKDHRTNYEVGNAQKVLDGDLNDFIEAYLRATVGNGHQ
jgi:peptide chain release factor 2